MATTLEKDEVDLICSGSYKGMDVRQNHEYGRLRRQHLLHKNVMNDKLIRVPLLTDTPITILDSGTGDGIWLLDAADEYPQATLTAEDHEKYDLVHQRYCLAQFDPEKDAEIVKGLWGLVKPGGYIQFVEADMMSFEGGEDHVGMSDFMKFVDKAFPQANMNHRPGPGIQKWLEAAGATDVNEEIHEFKMGAAATDENMRVATKENMNAIIANFAMFGSKWPGYWYTPDNFKDLADAVSHEMETTGNTWKFWLVTAKKKS